MSEMTDEQIEMECVLCTHAAVFPTGVMLNMNGTKHWCLLTTNPAFIPEIKSKPEESDQEVFWNCLTESWQSIDCEIVCTVVQHLDCLCDETGECPPPYMLLTLDPSDEKIIKYGNHVIEKNLSLIEDTKKILQDNNFDVSEQDMSLIINMVFSNREDGDTGSAIGEMQLIKLLSDVHEHNLSLSKCLNAFKTLNKTEFQLYMELKGEVQEQYIIENTTDVAVVDKAKQLIINSINKYVDEALTDLRGEEHEVSNEIYQPESIFYDSEQEFEENKTIELNEIKNVMNLVNTISGECAQSLSTLNDLHQVCAYWHPLLLPAPGFILELTTTDVVDE